jgi:xanthine dehydrogenase accessory factor
MTRQWLVAKMGDMREILAEVNAALDQNRPCVYCAVVETRGSTPQKAGAAMLVFADGSQRGTLGGGCVEAEVKQRALALLSAGNRPEMLTFSLDDNYGWDDGLICGGRMTMLVDPLSDGPGSEGEGSGVRGRGSGVRAQELGVRGYYRRFLELVESGRGCTEAVVVKAEAGQDSTAVGSRYLLDCTGKLAAQLGTGLPVESIQRHLQPVERRPAPALHQGLAFLPILPRITLLIVGGGHVGAAVGRLAAEADFEIWVLDDRERYASPERFPAAKRLLVGDIGRKLQELVKDSITPSTYCIIVTRGHAHDEEALYHLVASPAGYVGMIGSKRKIRLIYEDLIAKGIAPEQLERVLAPLGFDIGSQTVPEIAISIVAELIACRNLGTTRLPERVRVAAGNVRP